MLNNRVGGAVVIAALLVLLVAGVWGRSGDTPKKAATGPKSARLIKLLKERLTILKQIAADAEKAHKEGRGSLERVLRAAEAAHQAELDLCESSKQRIAILEKLVTLARQREDRAEKLARTGSISTAELLQARLGRLEAEIALERAKEQ